MIDMSSLGQNFMPRRRPEAVPGGVPEAPPPPGSFGTQFGGGAPQQATAPGFLNIPGDVSGGMGPRIPLDQPGVGGAPNIAPPPAQTYIQPGTRIPQQEPEQFMEGQVTPPGAGGFPYPEQWGTATDIYNRLGTGMPGMPDPSAIWGGYQQQAGDLSRELAEQAGMGMGSRYGSALQRNIADVGMRAGERFGGEMERLRMGDIAGQRQAMLGAAGGLSGLGGAQAMLPGQLAGQAMGLGGQLQGMQNIPLQAQYQEFLRQQPEYSPLLPYMQQFGANLPYGPQTYQPGFGSSMMDIGNMMAMYGMMGGG